ncbi:porin family protein [Vibrio kasasachensis]|uniref:outer membrane beta-barrel protein n=1 Tax=Vibrio kasasachensis TaxID=2910248 RepID=UPI003D1239C5
MTKILVIITASLITVSVNAAPFETSVSGFIGTKNVDDSAWKPFENQFEYGAVFDIKPVHWPVSIVAGVYGSSDGHDDSDGKTTHGFTSELLLGVRKTWSISGTDLHPYYGMGLAYIYGEMEDASDTHDDSAIGYWAGTGIYWTIDQHFDVGIEGRYSQAEIELDGSDIEAGGAHLGVTLGYRW